MVKAGASTCPTRSATPRADGAPRSRFALRRKVLPRAVADVKHVDDVVADGKEDAVVAVQELADFDAEGLGIRGERAAMR